MKKMTPGAYLVPERGLKNTKRNRRWCALVELLGRELGQAHEDTEMLAWKILKRLEQTT